jgi:hypothetical protein
MMRILVCLVGIMWLLSGCSQFYSKEEIVYDQGKLQKFAYVNESQGNKKSVASDTNFLSAIDVIKRTDPGALPQLADLPTAPPSMINPRSRKYTGIIKNNTKYEVSVPSLNSQGTLTIPPYGWIEYISWKKNFDLTVYSAGQPFYCLTISADPKNFQYACKCYDFIAEIVKPEPIEKGKKLKRRIRKRVKPKEAV